MAFERLDFELLQKLSNRPRPLNCESCPFKSRTCATRGPIDSPFVIVGESPGKNEIVHNAPFIGPSWKVLQESLNIPEGIEPYITNAFHCMPPQNKDLRSLKGAASSCQQRLINEISLHPRKVILALGNAAVWSLTGLFGATITSTRGRTYTSPLAEYGIVACLHPAALLHGFGSSRLFDRDVKLSCALLSGSGSPYVWVNADTILMETEGDIRDLIDQASEQDYIAADIETTGFSPRQDYILSHGFCWDSRTAYIVPPHLAHKIGDIYNPSIVPARFIWHNGKYDVGMLRGTFQREHSDWRVPQYQQYIRYQIQTVGNRWGYQFAKTDEDTMLLSYCLDETQGIHSLETVSNDWLGAPNWKSAVHKWLPKKGATYANIPPEELYLYQGKDLSNTLQAFHCLRPRVAADPKLERLYTQHLLPASEELTWMEGTGLNFDQSVAEANRVKYGTLEKQAFAEFDSLAVKTLGYSVNPNSWKQVQKLLYRGGLDIAQGKILSTDKDTLRAFPNAPGVKELQKVRKLRKLISTYIEGMIEAVEPSGRIHTTYKLHGTVTGRLASSDPVNLQNIVRNDDIKNQFCASLLYWLLSIDLSQAELRVLAILSGDKKLMEIFQAAESIHRIVARRFYGPSYNEDQYQLAKSVTFGIVYGRDAFSIAEEYQLPVEAAQEYINTWFKEFPDAHKFINRCRRAPLDGIVMVTPWGRKRRFGIVGPERIKSVGNEAANFPEQSMASDITLETLYTVGPTIRKWGIRPVNIVHDDIISEVPQRGGKELVHDVVKLIVKTMEEIPKRRGLKTVPFEAEWKIGTHWGSLTKSSKLPEDFFKMAI